MAAQDRDGTIDLLCGENADKLVRPSQSAKGNPMASARQQLLPMSIGPADQDDGARRATIACFAEHLRKPFRGG